MLLTVSKSATMLFVWVNLFLFINSVNSKRVASILERLNGRLKRADPNHINIAVRSYLDNRIDTFPPDPNYYPYHQYHVPSYPHLLPPQPYQKQPPKAVHRSPKEDLPNFGLELRPDFMRELPTLFQPERPNSLTNQARQPKQGLPKTSSSSKALPLDFDFNDLSLGTPLKQTVSSAKQDTTKSKELPLDFDFNDLSLGMPLKQTVSSAKQDTTKSSKSKSREVEEFEPLDPFLFSNLDLDKIPEEDLSLGDAALASFLGGSGGDTNPRSSATSEVDKVTDDIMVEFLKYMELKESGALDKCLNSQEKKKDN